MLKYILLTFGFFFFHFYGNAQKIEQNIKVESQPLNLNGKSPLYNYLGKIIGTTEHVKRNRQQKHATTKEVFKYTSRKKIKSNSGFELEIDALNKKVIYVADKIITYGTRNDQCSFIYIPDVIIYNKKGELLVHIAPTNLSNYSIAISKTGDVYLAGTYDKNYNGIVLVKINENGIVWKRKLSSNFRPSNRLNIAISPEGKKIAVIQDGSPLSKIFVFDTLGNLLNEIETDKGMSKIQFYGENQLINFSQSMYCLDFYNLENNESKVTRRLGSILDVMSTENHVLLLNPNKTFSAVYQRRKNELFFFEFDDNLNIVNKKKMEVKNLEDVRSSVILEDGLELYTETKKINLLVQ